MLAIRLQRHGRKDLPTYRLVVQESKRHPSSGRVVTYAGHHDPRGKITNIDKEKVSFYLQNGARPSDRVIRLLKEAKIDLPSWVQAISEKKRPTKNPEKLRKNQPKEEASSPEAPAEEVPAEDTSAEEAAPETETTESK